MPTYPLAPGTLLWHHPTDSVYEVLDPPGRFRVIIDRAENGDTPGRVFHNMWYYRTVCAGPTEDRTYVTVVDCPVKHRHAMQPETRQERGARE